MDPGSKSLRIHDSTPRWEQIYHERYADVGGNISELSAKIDAEQEGYAPQPEHPICDPPI